ncbi:MAG: hypothetical protein NWR10_03580, partial [Crocinitomicaceae bacterium]|nr:hypothetical protein [Crocinitomicaceae bacterium]
SSETNSGTNNTKAGSTKTDHKPGSKTNTGTHTGASTNQAGDSKTKHSGGDSETKTNQSKYKH